MPVFLGAGTVIHCLSGTESCGLLGLECSFSSEYMRFLYCQRLAASSSNLAKSLHLKILCLQHRSV